ncbi:MAG TPA: C-type lectin domain-containing protein [Polyangiaceae bacterium]|nr:C-type lectin domain-containing protein [Polyangiaceae bacterium]
MSFRFFTIGLACAGAAGGVLAAMACIPDLPNNAGGSPQDGSVAGPEAGKPFCGDGIIDLTSGEQCDPGPADGSAYCTADCQVVCDGGFVWSRNDHCYFDVPPGAQSLMEAINTRCTGGGAHVVTFASDEELAAVVGSIDAGDFWVGLQFDTTANGYTSVHALEPGWEPGCPGCFAHVIDASQPLPGDGGFCVEGFSDLTTSWQQYPCATDAGVRRRIHVICEREPAGVLQRTCTEAGVSCIELAWTAGSKRYVYFRNAAPSDGPDGSAEDTCTSLGGTLVVLQSPDEREQLWKAIGAPQGQSSFWIGLSMPEGGSTWVWDDDASEDAYPSPWAIRWPHDPGGRRAFLIQNVPAGVDDTLAHNGSGAASFFPFVCQLPP